MGAFLSHAAVDVPSDATTKWWDQHPVLREYAVERAYPTGSGRLFRTYRVRHRHSDTVAVVKVAWLNNQSNAAVDEDTASSTTAASTATHKDTSGGSSSSTTPTSARDTQAMVSALAQDLAALQTAARKCTAVWPYQFWCQGPPEHNNHNARFPVALLRPHVYTTLRERANNSRPFWGAAEKTYAVVQLLQAVDALHQAGLVHGHLTATNVGVTSVGRLVLLDGWPALKQTTLPANDPTAYLYLFQTTSYNATTTASTPCTLAPERFVDNSTIATQQTVTPSMDIFALGCIVVEVSLGQALFGTLGQLLAYRNGGDENVVTAALAKLPSSALRAAAKHMLQRDPAQRLTASAYLDRLAATGQVPPTFEMLNALVADASGGNKNDVLVTPDARLVQCVQIYPRMVQAAMGQTLNDSSLAKWRRWTAATTRSDDDEDASTPSAAAAGGGNTNTGTTSTDNTLDLSSLIAETQALLESLEMGPEEETDKPSPAGAAPSTKASASANDPEEPPSQLCKDSLIIYLQIILSTLRHVQRPASKWVALQLVQDLGQWTNDESRLSRIIPVTVSLLHDSDALVRATALQVLTHTVAQVTTFAPSDAALFSQYLVKRVSHLPSDPALVVRLAFAHSVAVWAHIAQQFLDVAHAVRLYEASALGLEGTGGSRSGSATPRTTSAPLIEASSRSVSSQDTVFSDDVAQLLDSAGTTAAGAKSAELPSAGKRALLGSSYLADRESLYETVSRWVVHLATDQSADASLAQRALLRHMDQLCHFFGSTGVMNFLLPQIVTFLNDRKDWQLRAALFDNFTPVGQAIGRAATEEFVLPCLEIGLIDSEEQVIQAALGCLGRFVELGLVSRASLVGSGEQDVQHLRTGRQGLLERYVIFLLHPSEGIRRVATSLFCRVSHSLGGPDILVYIIPILKPLFIYRPTMQHLTNSIKLPYCLVSPFSRQDFQKELGHFAVQPSGAWTTIGVPGSDRGDVSTKNANGTEGHPMMCIPSIKEYLRMLSTHNAQISSIDSPQHRLSHAKVAPCIEANLKLAQSVMFPRQDYCTSRTYLPEWYETIQKKAGREKSEVSAQSTVTSIGTLGAVYGISIMGPVEGTSESIIGAAAEDGVLQEANKEHSLVVEEAKLVEAASRGHWSAESLLDPDVVDASLLVTKLKALGVPQLPPKLGEQFVSKSKLPVKNTGRGAPKDAAPSEWRPRINALVATSSTITGHKAPVVRLAVSVDSAFFVSGSHDGTCGIWETSQLDDCVGILDSSLVYSGHNDIRPARINDVAMVEGTHSVVSVDSNGSVHVWRVDMIQSSNAQSTNRAARAVGSSEVRQIDAKEGEVLAVTHFTGLSSSVLLYATQKGTIHSWDLRCAQEPFAFRHSPCLGHLTTVALGNDRQWLVSGTNKGYVALWDVRFQNTVKLWRHNSGEKIHRVATSFVPPPQYWSGRFANTNPRPFVFLGSGANECAMFDLINGSCTECFRTVWADSRVQNEGLPSLLDIKIKSGSGSNTLVPSGPQFQSPVVSSYPAINCMVGSVGGQNQSFLMTGGSDRRIRFWDFAAPSRCYSVAGEPSNAPRSSYERIDYDAPRRLMLCHQAPSRVLRESGIIGNFAYKGLKKPENHHTDDIMDLKIIDNGLVSCSRDCTLKVWR